MIQQTGKINKISKLKCTFYMQTQSMIRKHIITYYETGKLNLKKYILMCTFYMQPQSIITKSVITYYEPGTKNLFKNIWGIYFL